MSTHFFPVSGKEQSESILWAPFLAVCSIVTTTFVLGADTKSIAPPIPFTILPCKNIIATRNSNLKNTKKYYIIKSVLKKP